MTAMAAKCKARANAPETDENALAPFAGVVDAVPPGFVETTQGAGLLKQAWVGAKGDEAMEYATRKQFRAYSAAREAHGGDALAAFLAPAVAAARAIRADARLETEKPDEWRLAQRVIDAAETARILGARGEWEIAAARGAVAAALGERLLIALAHNSTIIARDARLEKLEAENLTRALNAPAEARRRNAKLQAAADEIMSRDPAALKSMLQIAKDAAIKIKDDRKPRTLRELIIYPARYRE